MGLVSERTVYVNEERPFGEWTTDVIQANGWEVVNAPRPLAGEVTWNGPFRHGCFYAAGPREVFGRSWESDDAWPVEVITNEQIVARLEAHCEAEGIDRDALDAALDLYHGWPGLARQYGFPWREDA